MQTFPDGFLWGAATAAHQIEGGNVGSDWWLKEHAPGTDISEPSGDACDSYHRYPEDMQLLADAGLNAYRFSVEWARIEPEQDMFSRAAIDHYRRMVDTARDLGLEPVVTLHHFTVPAWFDASGAWRRDDAVARFSRYVDMLEPILRDDVRWVTTINEPNIAAMLARHRDGDAELQAGTMPAPDAEVSDVLVAAHKEAVVRMRGLGIKAGWPVATQAFQAIDGGEDTLEAYAWPRERFFLDAAKGDDFVGVQAYTRTQVTPAGPLPPADGVETTLTGWEYYPHALAEGVALSRELTDDLPVMITENGIATADDARRIDYTRDSLLGLKEQMDDGADVVGYLHWSALDNYEWGSFTPTFGLIAVDRETFVRTPKPSLAWLGEVARSKGTSLG